MEFFNSAVGVLQTLVIASWCQSWYLGAINLLEGYGNDNLGAKSQGMKQFILWVCRSTIYRQAGSRESLSLPGVSSHLYSGIGSLCACQD